MAYGTIELLAIITIAIVVIKLFWLAIAPKHIIKVGKKMFAKPAYLSLIYLVLAFAVLYFLVRGGMTIAQILAVMLFASLLIRSALAVYTKDLLKQIKPETIMKDMWWYIIVLIALIAWGIYTIFF